jgi:hypothetical protein
MTPIRRRGPTGATPEALANEKISHHQGTDSPPQDNAPLGEITGSPDLHIPSPRDGGIPSVPVGMGPIAREAPGFPGDLTVHARAAPPGSHYPSPQASDRGCCGVLGGSKSCTR